MRTASFTPAFSGAIALLCSFLIAIHRVAAQASRATFHGTSAGEFFGIGLAGLGDLDGDGIPDFGIGAFQADVQGTDSGSVHLYSGAQLTPLYSLHGSAAGDWFGRSLAAVGDLDGDQHADFVVGATRADPGGTNRGLARVFSGAGGTLLFEVTGDRDFDYLGWRVAGLGDVNRDGVPDFAVTAHDHVSFAQADHVRVYSGQDASTLFTFHGDHAGHTLGTAVAGPGDVNGDGHADLLVGAAFDDLAGLDAGSARLYSGKDGVLLWHQDGFAAGDRFGLSVCAAGDVNADGTPDWIVSGNGSDVQGPDSGSIWVFSGADGSVLHALHGAQPGDVLGNCAPAGDQNRDGHADFLIGAPGSTRGEAQLISGRTGISLYTWEGRAGGDSMGRSLASIGDLDGDGSDELMIASPAAVAVGVRAGCVDVFHGNDLFLQSANPQARAGDTLVLRLRGGVPLAPAGLWLTSWNGSSIPRLLTLSAINANSRKSFLFTVPAGLGGLQAVFQAFSIDPTGRLTDTDGETIDFL